MVKIDREKGIALIAIQGVPTLLDIQHAIDELLDNPGHVDGMGEIWDLREARMTSFSADDLIELAEYVKQRVNRLAKRVAYVMGPRVDYGMGRMWISYSDIPAPQTRNLFQNIDDAIEWLDS